MLTVKVSLTTDQDDPELYSFNVIASDSGDPRSALLLYNASSSARMSSDKPEAVPKLNSGETQPRKTLGVCDMKTRFGGF